MVYPWFIISVTCLKFFKLAKVLKQDDFNSAMFWYGQIYANRFL